MKSLKNYKKWKNYPQKGSVTKNATIESLFPVCFSSSNVCDAGQPEQNWNNGKIKGYDLGVST